MGGGWGNYSISGQVNFRHHKAGLGPGDGENTQERAWRFEGNVLILEGIGPHEVAAGPRAQAAESDARLDARWSGSWERTAYTVNGAAGTTTPEHLLLGEDGWFHATTLPAGRKGVPKVPQDQWTPRAIRGAPTTACQRRAAPTTCPATRSCAATSPIPIRTSKTS